jgi:uncharacterized UBP type Zn finger protein
MQALAAVQSAAARVCVDCVRTGRRWVHLRTCQTCGETRCCDNSPGRHARQHAQTTDHPVISSAEPGERWIYCYPDDVMTRY